MFNGAGAMTGSAALLIVLGVAIVGALIGWYRGHNLVLAMLVSAVLGWLVWFPVGWVLLLAVPGKKHCPQCRERIQRKAMQCRFCGYSYGAALSAGH